MRGLAASASTVKAAGVTASRGAPSGSDASCPATTSAATGSAAVGAPQRVRAIGGSASATVVWCPPAADAGSVVSYTVTSSGGQQVTAAVPNDWAIVDGLTNGTSYTFTVKANTKPGPAGAAATSNGRDMNEFLTWPSRPGST